MSERTAPDCVGTDSIRGLIDFDEWANLRVIDASRPLPEAGLMTRFPMGPGSLYDVLVHLAATNIRWSDRIGDRTLRASLEEDGQTRSLTDIAASVRSGAQDLRDVYAQTVNAGTLDELMTVTLAGFPEPFVFARRSAFLHVMTHGAHHRAQALNMLRLLGETPPDVDVIEFAIG